MKLEIVSPAEKKKGARRDAVVVFVARPEKKEPARFETVPDELREAARAGAPPGRRERRIGLDGPARRGRPREPPLRLRHRHGRGDGPAQGAWPAARGGPQPSRRTASVRSRRLPLHAPEDEPGRGAGLRRPQPPRGRLRLPSLQERRERPGEARGDGSPGGPRRLRRRLAEGAAGGVRRGLEGRRDGGVRARPREHPVERHGPADVRRRREGGREEARA